METVCRLFGLMFHFLKTTLLNVLAERTETGIVSGTRLVHGHPLPPDFQSQT